MRNDRIRFFIVALIVAFIAFPLHSATAQSDAEPDASSARGSGFTLLLNMGVGMQNDGAYEESAIGLSGLNIGIGGFLTDNIALMFRISGTSVKYSFDAEFFGTEFDIDQTSGVGGPTIQYWVSDKLNIEGGLGYGFWSSEGFSESGFGAILGIAYVVFQTGNSNFQVGAEFAPAFLDPETVYNFGLVFGWQLR